MRAPSFAVLSVLTLALGIGVNTALFSVADAILLRPLPYPEAEELVSVWLDPVEREGASRSRLSRVDLDALVAEPSLFQAIAGGAEWTPTLSSAAGPSVLAAAVVTEGMFGRVLGVQPVLGRTFRQEEHLADGTRTVLISDSFWSKHFDRDPDVLGRAVALDDVPYTVVGVMPPRFRAPIRPDATLWAPALRGSDPGPMAVVARLAPGTSPEIARERARLMGQRAGEAWPGALIGATLSIADLRRELLGPLPAGMGLLLIGFGTLLLVSCGNAAALFVVRGADRAPDIAVRRALGADRSDLRRHLFAESALLCAAGGAAGLAGAAWAMDVLFEFAPLPPGVFEAPTPGGRAAVFAMGVALGCAVLIARLVAATGGEGWHLVSSSRSSVWDAVRIAFVGAQVACALALLTGAGMLFESLRGLDRSGLGLDVDERYVVVYDAAVPRLDASRASTFYADAMERLATLPGAVSVALTSGLPPETEPVRRPIRLDDPAVRPAWEGVRSGRAEVEVRAVSAGYFYTVGQRLLAGRAFNGTDDGDAPEVAIVSETLARTFFDWPRTSPVGRRISVSVSMSGEQTTRWRSIVGVVSDVRHGPRSPEAAEVYLPAPQAPSRSAVLVTQLNGDPSEVVQSIERALSGRDDPMAPRRVAPLSSTVQEMTRRERFAARLMLAIALVTLGLAAIGLYGVVGQRVSAHVRELGIRRAVGATSEDLRRLVTRRAMRLTVGGMAVGIAAAIGITDFLGALLFGIPRVDPLAIAGASGLLLLAALVAAGIPARRVLRIDATRVLADEQGPWSTPRRPTQQAVVPSSWRVSARTRPRLRGNR